MRPILLLAMLLLVPIHSAHAIDQDDDNRIIYDDGPSNSGGGTDRSGNGTPAVCLGENNNTVSENEDWRGPTGGMGLHREPGKAFKPCDSSPAL